MAFLTATSYSGKSADAASADVPDLAIPVADQPAGTKIEKRLKQLSVSLRPHRRQPPVLRDRDPRTGAAALAEEVPAEWRTMYMDFTARMLDKFRIYRELDDAFFHLLDLEMFPRPLSSGFDPKKWKTVPTVPSRLLADGDVRDH